MAKSMDEMINCSICGCVACFASKKALVTLSMTRCDKCKSALEELSPSARRFALILLERVSRLEEKLKGRKR